MLKIRTEHLRTLSRRILGTLFTLVIALAVIIQLGRQAFPMISDYRDEITLQIEKRIGMKVEVDELQAEWSGLRPSVGMRNVRVISEDGVAIFVIQHASAQLSLVESLLEWRLAWRQLKLDGFETSLVQAKDGRWSVYGAPKFTPLNQDNDNASPIIDDPYDLFLFGRRINLSNARFFVQFDSGKVVDIQIPQISLENDKNFHRLVAELDVEEGQEGFQLIVEGQGDPRDDRFKSNGYLELKNFSTTKVMQALGGKVAGKSIPLSEDTENKLNVRMWFRGTPTSGMTFRGSLGAKGFPFALDPELHNLPTQLNAELVGKFHREDGWNMGIRDLQVLWPERQSPELDIQLSGAIGKPITIETSDLALADISELLLHFGLNNERATELVSALNVSGHMSGISVTLTDKERGYFRAQANLSKVNSGAILGVPEFKNVSGDVSFSAFNGALNIAVDDGFSIHLPKVYNDAMAFDEASGQIAWEVDLDKKMTYITSGLLRVKNADEEGHGYLRLSLPFKKEFGEQEMTLSIGIEETLAANHKRYVPKTIPKHLYNWLDSSIKEGVVKNVRFLFSGSVEKDSEIKPTIQLYAEVQDGNIVFDPKWPVLKGVSGILRLNNNDLDVRIAKASLLGNSVHDANISVVNGENDNRLLSITGGVDSDVESAMALLKASPIREHIGSTFDSWEVAGGVSAKVALLIPLSSDEQGLSHKIDVRFSKADLRIPTLDLDIDNISGVLHYKTDKGVYADKLSGSVWGERISASVASPRNAQGGFDTEIGFRGPLAIEKLTAWTNRPELRFAEGKAEVDGKLEILQQGDGESEVKLTVASSLAGVAIDLPAPFKKASDELADFSGTIRFAEDREAFEFLYGEELRVLMLSDEYFSISSVIELGRFDPRPASEILSATGRFDIRGQLSKLELELWSEVLDKYLAYSNEMLGASDDAEPTPTELDVLIDKFYLGSFEIDQLRVKGKRQWPNWLLQIDSELMAGLVTVSEEDTPIQLDLDYVKIESDEDEGTETPVEGISTVEAQTEESVLADLDLSRAVALKFSTKELYLGEENYGQWSFNLNPIEQGIAINNIRAKVKNMRVGEEGVGANFLWLKDGNKQSSQFVGTIRSDNLADVFNAWGQEELLQSESARIDIDAQWNAAPDEVTLKMVKGLVILDVQQGSFNRGAGSDENALLRLLALFNFDTIVRRLRLDFADLAAQGFSYDKIYGSLNFEDGTIYLTEPMIVESSSSVVQVAGAIDVVNEKLDTEMVVTLPFASNLAVATAVVAGLPTAVGIYLMGKMFKSQVDKASSINMQVTGKWEDPKIKISKIFDIDAATRKGKELEKKAKNKVSEDFHTDPILENELEQRLPPVED